MIYFDQSLLTFTFYYCLVTGMQKGDNRGFAEHYSGLELDQFSDVFTIVGTLRAQLLLQFYHLVLMKRQRYFGLKMCMCFGYYSQIIMIIIVPFYKLNLVKSFLAFQFFRFLLDFLLCYSHLVFILWNRYCRLVYKSLVVRKPVFGVSDQVPQKAGCTATEDG